MNLWFTVWTESAAHLVSECSPEGAGPSAEEEGLSIEKEGPVKKPGAGPESHLTLDITAAFKTFKTQLEQHFTVSNHSYWLLALIISIN